MKKIDDVMAALRLCYTGQDLDAHDPCEGCPYSLPEGEAWSSEDCIKELHEDAEHHIEQLQEQVRALRTEIAVNRCGEEVFPGGEYWQRITEMNRKQEAKGRKKYGEPLEANTTLTMVQRIEHLQEELIDGLKYAEHLKEIANDGITANDYQRAALRTDNKDQTEEERMLDALFGLCGEAGEVMDAYKKYRFQGHESYRDEMIIEASDCLWYLAKLADVLGVTLGEVMERNIEKLKKRFPDGFSKDRSMNRE